MDSEADPFAIFTMPTNTQKRPIESDPNQAPPRKRLNLEMERDDSEDDELMAKKLEDIEIVCQKSEEGCLHEVYYPKGYARKTYNGAYNAKKYKFKLDPFQRKSVHAIECEESVLVCAHTSAGKTAIAEYAIATSLRNRSRVIYTSPIKALSNQKYRELKDEFDDVGLVTGDVTIAETSTCLVMTTEILRNMIYRGSEVVRQVSWVIFDEVHYMRDKERGVVWEQTIIMLPSNVKYVFLSATIGNPSQFACWITKLRKQPCNVVYTDYRPVPLEHYLCPAGGEGLYLVVDDRGKFHEDSFARAVEALGDVVPVVGAEQRKKKSSSSGSDLFKIIKIVMEQRLDPVIVFSFSKKDVEAYAKSVCLKYDLTTKAEKDRIEEIFRNSVNILEEKDRQLPQITSMKEIVRRGIGIHHGGLLPLIKEVVELLFQENLLKVLFSTETFSMGLNMPARTVVFTSVRKFDGQKPRWIRGGQYIQMSGRAGRRGLDKKGTTILMIDQKMEPEIAKDMLKGRSDDLLSSFYLSYNMLLNSQRLEDIDSDHILARSLLQFQHESKLPSLTAAYNDKITAYRQFPLDQQQRLEGLTTLQQRLDECRKKYRKLVYTSQRVVPYMSIGRVVRVGFEGIDWGYGISINFHSKGGKNRRDGSEGNEAAFFFDIMVHIESRTIGQQIKPVPYSVQGQMAILTFSIDCIQEITTVKISSLPKDLTIPASKRTIEKTMAALMTRELPLLTLESKEPEALELVRAITKSQQQLNSFGDILDQLPVYSQKKALEAQLTNLNQQIKSVKTIVLRKEKKGFMRVMKKTGLLGNGVVTSKGNVACEISSNHQILLTELLFDGYFNDMTPEELAAVLTSLVHDQKSQLDRKVTKSPRLIAKHAQLVTKAKSIFSIFQQCKIPLEEVILIRLQEDYLETIKEQLMEVTFEWCNGADFLTICKMTDTYQGSIIRTLRRLNELLRQLSNAAKVIGNPEIAQKFETASVKVFRGIVFAASLYTF